jgi:hypothetical protein
MADWTAGLKARKGAIETASRALRDLPRPESLSSKRLMTWEEFDLDSSRRFYARCIAEVVVFPKANGERLLCDGGERRRGSRSHRFRG